MSCYVLQIPAVCLSATTSIPLHSNNVHLNAVENVYDLSSIMHKAVSEKVFSYSNYKNVQKI